MWTLKSLFILFLKHIDSYPIRYEHSSSISTSRKVFQESYCSIGTAQPESKSQYLSLSKGGYPCYTCVRWENWIETPFPKCARGSNFQLSDQESEFNKSTSSLLVQNITIQNVVQYNLYDFMTYVFNCVAETLI